MGRKPCCDKIGLKRGPWTIDEDRRLANFILNNGIQCWRLVPKLAGLMRCGKSCRLRWINYLRPDLKRGSLTEAEEDMIIQLHSRYGNRWSKIASHFPGRTDNEIKNQWNTKIKKKLKHLGLDPITHKPVSNQEMISKDEKENVESKSSSENQENKTVELDCHDDDSDRNSKGGEASEFGPGENNNCFENNNNNKEIWENLSTYETRPSSNEFSVGVSEETIDDLYQQWIHSPNNMLSWDNFCYFDEVLFNVPPNFGGTNL